MIERVARQVEANPGSQLWIASSMGQRATMAEGLETQLYLTQPTRFFEAMGLPDEDAWQRRPAMLPQFNLVVEDKFVEQFRSRSPCSRSRRPSCGPWTSSRRPTWPSRPCSPSCCPPDAPAGAVSRVMAFFEGGTEQVFGGSIWGRLEQPVQVGHGRLAVQRPRDLVAVPGVGAVVAAEPVAVGGGGPGSVTG